MKDILLFISREYGEEFLKEILESKPTEYQTYQAEQFLQERRTFPKTQKEKCICQNCKKLIFKPNDKLYHNKYNNCERCYILYIEGRNINGNCS
jgi:hydrogenase maturation factor HypF (carbamoyltransferase family)